MYSFPPVEDLMSAKTQQGAAGPKPALSEPPSPIPEATSFTHGLRRNGLKEDLWSRIESILDNQASYQTLLAQRDERAQYFLDILQNLYDYPHVSSKLRSNIFSAMLRLSKASGLYPSCLVLNNVTKLGNHPVSSGGFGEIWKGLIGEQLACLKVVRIYGDSDVQKLLKEFVKEAILWRQLDHPNVLPFLGIFFLDATKERVCLISPWMENGNLRKYINSRNDEHIDRILLAYDVACGLSYLHQEKVVHGDLKGDNILITSAGRAAIADFGLSVIANSEALNWSSLSTSNQGRGGSARWLAPECLIEGNNFTYSSDIYAFGGVCYEVFTGLLPFYECVHDAAVIFQLMKAKRPTRPTNASQLNNTIWALMQECWDQEPLTRPAAKLLPGRLSTAADRYDIKPADTWDTCLPSQLWDSVQRKHYPRSAEFEHALLDSYSRLRADTDLIVLPSKSTSDPEKAAGTREDDNNIVYSEPAAPSQVHGPSEPKRPTEEDVSPDSGLEVTRKDWVWIWEYDQNNLTNCSLLSHLAVQLRDRVPRETHIKGGISYPRSFTGKDIVTTIQQLIQDKLVLDYRLSINDRRAALQIARSLQSQMFFHEVGFEGRLVRDGVEDVYTLFDESEDGGLSQSDTTTSPPLSSSGKQLPTAVITMLTKCYMPTCDDPEGGCYAFDCPRKGRSILAAINREELAKPPPLSQNKVWSEIVPIEVMQSLSRSEVNRQTIHNIFCQEDQYVHDLDIIDYIYVRPLRNANPPVISPPAALEQFISDVFGNILELRERNKRLLEAMTVRQRESRYTIQRIGDIFLNAAAEFRQIYPNYLALRALAEKRTRDELEDNSQFRGFLEQASSRLEIRWQDTRQALGHFLSRPLGHLQKLLALLESVLRETSTDHQDAEDLRGAIGIIQTFTQLRTRRSRFDYFSRQRNH